MDPVPALGADSIAIARELGASDDDIDALLSSGVLGAPTQKTGTAQGGTS